MTTPHIGDVVHYVPQLGSPTCLAAIVTAINEDASEIITRVLDPRSINDYPAYPSPDPNGPITVRGANGETVISEDNWTPGTWHHIH